MIFENNILVSGANFNDWMVLDFDTQFGVSLS